MKDIKDALNESLLNEATTHKVLAKIAPYTRGYFERESVFVEFKAADRYDMIRKLAKNCLLYMYEEDFEVDGDYYLDPKTPQSVRDTKAEYLIEKIIESNGDGCDLIAYLSFDKDVIIDIVEEQEFYPRHPKKVDW